MDIDSDEAKEWTRLMSLTSSQEVEIAQLLEENAQYVKDTEWNECVINDLREKLHEARKQLDRAKQALVRIATNDFRHPMNHRDVANECLSALSDDVREDGK